MFGRNRRYPYSAIVALALAGVLVALTLYRACYQSDRDDVAAPILMAAVLAALALRRIIATQRRR